MILKKPYAFLIKHFRLIHFLLTLLYVYLAFYVSGVLNFYNGFIGGFIGKLGAMDYISNVPYLVIIFSVVICLILFILMNYKKKPKFLYMMLILLYVIVFVLIFVTSNGLSIIYNSVLDTKTILLYRDFLRIAIFFQYGSIVLTTIRAIGFDLKKFNFRDDLSELDIDVADDEEVELVVGLNSHKLTQKINRKLREFKYYYVENRMFVMVMVGIFILMLLSTITIDKTVVNKVYKQNEMFSSDNFNIQITDSYVTNQSYDGNKITDKSAFLVVKLYIEPKNTFMSLNTSNVVLKTANNKYTITKKYYNYFKDLGTGYNDQIIKTGKNYILVYQILIEEIDDELQIIYTGSKKEIKVDISPKNLDENEIEKEYKLGEVLDFSDSILSGSSYQIMSYEVKDKYSYTYVYVINDKEYTGKNNITSQSNTILYLDLKSSYNINVTDFELIEDYGGVRYIVDGTEYISQRLSNKTPGSLNKGIYLEVDKSVETAESIWIELNIRNIRYKYIIK